MFVESLEYVVESEGLLKKIKVLDVTEKTILYKDIDFSNSTIREFISKFKIVEKIKTSEVLAESSFDIGLDKDPPKKKSLFELDQEFSTMNNKQKLAYLIQRDLDDSIEKSKEEIKLSKDITSSIKIKPYNPWKVLKFDNSYSIAIYGRIKNNKSNKILKPQGRSGVTIAGKYYNTNELVYEYFNIVKV